MLLWMAKTAHESSMKRVLNQVLVSLLEVCEKGSAKGIDLLVLVRYGFFFFSYGVSVERV